IGVKCSIVGHSERRSLGETDELINQKLRALLAVRSAAILCIGERERDGSGDYFNMVEEQLEMDLAGVKSADLKNVIIAYEPVWAIGTQNNAGAADVEEMKLFIQKVLSDIYGRKEAESVRIIYGGSVSPDNAEELLKGGKADGFLVGGASLEAKKFIEIIKIADKYARLA
ncbi:MAG: triose-phosphate isomerase, partial [Candidatus Paceibacterota bacterium]